MSTENERPVWDAERIARMRAGAKSERASMIVRRDDVLSLLDELERVRQERDALDKRVELQAVVIGLARLRLARGQVELASATLDASTRA